MCVISATAEYLIEHFGQHFSLAFQATDAKRLNELINNGHVWTSVRVNGYRQRVKKPDFRGWTRIDAPQDALESWPWRMASGPFATPPLTCTEQPALNRWLAGRQAGTSGSSVLNAFVVSIACLVYFRIFVFSIFSVPLTYYPPSLCQSLSPHSVSRRRTLP